MSSAKLTAAKDEIVAALAVVDPLIEGNQDLAVASITEETAAIVRDVILTRRRRRDLLKKTLSAIDELEGDGYPDMLPTIVSQKNLDELKAELAAITAAVAAYTANKPATTIKAELGNPVEK